MIDWFAWALVGVSVVAGLVCALGAGRGWAPNDYTLGATLVVEVLLVVQVVIALLAPLAGNHATGSVLEFWIYLVTAVLLLPLAGLWALIERNRWSNLVLAVANLAVAVMVFRMLHIWTVQVA